MDLTAIGSAGAGFVWGWVLAGCLQPHRRAAMLALAVGSMLLVTEIGFLADARAATAAAMAGVLGIVVASRWRRRLAAAWTREEA
jgi:hypothetical protein